MDRIVRVYNCTDVCENGSTRIDIESLAPRVFRFLEAPTFSELVGRIESQLRFLRNSIELQGRYDAGFGGKRCPVTMPIESCSDCDTYREIVKGSDIRSLELCVWKGQPRSVETEMPDFDGMDTHPEEVPLVEEVMHSQPPFSQPSTHEEFALRDHRVQVISSRLHGMSVCPMNVQLHCNSAIPSSVELPMNVSFEAAVMNNNCDDEDFMNDSDGDEDGANGSDDLKDRGLSTRGG